VSPARGYRGQQYTANIEGLQVVEASPIPLVACARTLMAEGADPTALLVMRWPDRTDDALRTTVGAAVSAGSPRQRDVEPRQAASRYRQNENAPAGLLTEPAATDAPVRPPNRFGSASTGSGLMPCVERRPMALVLLVWRLTMLAG